MLEMRKRRKMARLGNQQQPKPAAAACVNLTTCDLGASPNLQPKVLKPYNQRASPLMQARGTELRQKNKGKK